MNNPQVTICTSIYNHEQYLDDYFESIVNQTYENIQLILIDDCSTDHSTKVVEKWMGRLEDRFNSFRYIPRTENMGLIYNCNQLISLAEGKYICLFASDDAMAAKNIEEKVKFLETNIDFGMVYSDGYFVKESDHLMSQNFEGDFKKFSQSKNFYEGNILIHLIEEGNFIQAPSVLVRKEVLHEFGGYSEEYMFEDYYMWLKIAMKYEVGYITEPLVYYRQTSNSLSRKPESYTKMIGDHERLLLRLDGKYKSHIKVGLDNLYKRACKYYFKKNMKEHYNSIYMKLNDHDWKCIVMKFILQLGISPIPIIKLVKR